MRHARRSPIIFSLTRSQSVKGMEVVREKGKSLDVSEMARVVEVY